MSSLKKRVITGSFWSFGSYGVNQVIRLGSNLILTRLLFPEAFGLMSLVQVFMQGLEMFSDIGINPSIVQNERRDRDFLNTAWTIQVIRGFFLWFGASLLAWPAVAFYNEPMLMQLLPVVGSTAAIRGFRSTKLAVHTRELKLAKPLLMELGSYILGVITMISFALIYSSVWALVVGGIVGAIANTISSHFMLSGEPNRFAWDASAFQAIKNFGKWIFFSTLVTYLAGEGDRLLLGNLLSFELLGIFSIANMLSRTISQAVKKVSGKVLFPSYSEVIRERPQHLYFQLRKSRLVIVIVTWIPSLIFLFFGSNIIDFLYDDRYSAAGWMLQIFAAGQLVDCLSLSSDKVLLAKGLANINALLLSFQVGMKLLGIFLGFQFGGVEGLIISLAAVNWLIYPVRSYFFKRLSLWQPELDFPVIALASIVIAIRFVVLP